MANRTAQALKRRPLRAVKKPWNLTQPEHLGIPRHMRGVQRHLSIDEVELNAHGAGACERCFAQARFPEILRNAR